jgi:hypothetical protein
MSDQGQLPEQATERLIVVEQAGRFMVVSEDDPNDWVASFTPDERFPARDWAERMAELYNLRGHDERNPDNAPIFTGTHHPRTHSQVRGQE